MLPDYQTDLIPAACSDHYRTLFLIFDTLIGVDSFQIHRNDCNPTSWIATVVLQQLDCNSRLKIAVVFPQPIFPMTMLRMLPGGNWLLFRASSVVGIHTVFANIQACRSGVQELNALLYAFHSLYVDLVLPPFEYTDNAKHL